MLAMAQTRLADAGLPDASPEGRFLSAYNAAHGAALAALRWHGYRAESRYIVFQCLSHTLSCLGADRRSDEARGGDMTPINAGLA